MKQAIRQISDLVEPFEPWLEALAQEPSPKNYLSRGLRGSTESDFEGKSQKQPHSFPAFGYSVSRASGR